MPYSKEHKENSRAKILGSAFRLFAKKGFDGVTVNAVMSDCGLTRGAFYAHFSSKSSLYGESLKFGASRTNLAKLKPESISNREWLCLLLDGYLSLEHVRGESPCPLAFLATDIVTQNEETKTVYAAIYNNMNEAIRTYAKSYIDCDEYDILSITSMIIGAVAIARTMSDNNAVTNLLAACRREAGLKLGGI